MLVVNVMIFLTVNSITSCHFPVRMTLISLTRSLPYRCSFKTTSVILYSTFDIDICPAFYDTRQMIVINAAVRRTITGNFFNAHIQLEDELEETEMALRKFLSKEQRKGSCWKTTL